MWPLSRHEDSDSKDLSALVDVVRPFDHRTRRALYAATNSGVLRRKTWSGCAFNRAGAMVGTPISSQYQAADVFGISPRLIANFVSVWDRLRGPDRRCTDLLRSAILTAGLFPLRAPTRLADSTCALVPNPVADPPEAD